MSTFAVPVVEYVLEKHPNADVLSIAKIKNTDWQCIVKSSEFVNEASTIGVYVKTDSIAAKDNPFLAFLEGKKIKTVRLRGVISQGILIPGSKVEQALGRQLVLGEDLAKELRIRKYEAPVNNVIGCCDAIAAPPDFISYTEIENVKNFPNIFLENEEVFVTEKLHGTNVRYGLIDDIFYIGSHHRALRLDNYKNSTGEDVFIKRTAWHNIAEDIKIKEKLLEMRAALNTNSLIVFGEIFGRGIQDLYYGQSAYTFRLFDITVDGCYLPPKERCEISKRFLIETVPILYTGPMNKDVLDLRFGKDTISQTHIREGIIIEPIVPRFDISLGRVKLKCVSEDYLLRKNATDFDG
jgi:RNA ligase (TIGR02306 family)